MVASHCHPHVQIIIHHYCIILKAHIVEQCGVSVCCKAWVCESTRFLEVDKIITGHKKDGLYWYIGLQFAIWSCRDRKTTFTPLTVQFPKSPLPQESQRVGHSYLEERYDPPLKSKYDVVTLTIAQDFKENSIFFNCLQTLQRFSNRCLHFESFLRIWLLSYEETKSPFHLIHLLLI